MAKNKVCPTFLSTVPVDCNFETVTQIGTTRNYHLGKFMLCKGATRPIIPDNKVLLDQTLTSLQ